MYFIMHASKFVLQNNELIYNDYYAIKKIQYPHKGKTFSS